MPKNTEAVAGATDNGIAGSGDKEQLPASRFEEYAIAIFVGVLYLPVSVFFMMWWGYAGSSPGAPSWVSGGLPAQATAYVAISLAAIHLPLFAARRLVRTVALLFWIAPWAVVMFAGIAGSSASTMFWAVCVPAVCYYGHTFLESLRT